MNVELKEFRRSVKAELKYVSDGYGYIDYHNGRKFIKIISDFVDQINDDFEYQESKVINDKLFFLYKIIDTVEMDGSNGEHLDAFYIVSEVLLNTLVFNLKYIKRRIVALSKKEVTTIEIDLLLLELIVDNSNSFNGEIVREINKLMDKVIENREGTYMMELLLEYKSKLSNVTFI